ncbi:MAG: twin-arginine translocase subunit TatC [Candidatus Marinimicrobia bacterium]|jgi:sec-independent protein translocase protein TatC|nr:twin-arginine translocase subunit TatC [Candidatus Neomarinimicrobiota bacterium]MBT3495813.1 twin-arginine translocase subunit TatC [Candidatus Neomarinimicrobiota bacterium]MBT3692207.1 twin-arginine translocase subunit TatC [Candidatus Neomarinimicrobiota bacterium]MBT3732483.1 twin-arginine translocase subunit TatC [Candidatus Neomarinimicrobiota bacterium]MBT4144254.1 twin-arginine translocase subunit TatC [Candidatus Neomarinimicrobiota bacterium]
MPKKASEEMGFLDHLEELRWRLIKILGSIVIVGAISFSFIDQILAILLYPTTQVKNSLNLQVLTIQGMFMIKWSIALITGIIGSIPVLTYQLWKFVAPGLYLDEKKYAIPLVIFTFVSFSVGVIFAYMVIIPFSLEFFTSMGYGDVQNNYSINYYFSFMTWILLGSGFIFLLPVVSFFFSVIGLLTPPFMRHYRRHAIVTIMIISSFITPPDPVSMLVMALPLSLLYELSIGVSWFVLKGKREKKVENEE